MGDPFPAPPESCCECHPNNFPRLISVTAQGSLLRALRFPVLSQSALPAKPLLPCTFKAWERGGSAGIFFLRSRTGFSSSGLRLESHSGGIGRCCHRAGGESLLGNGVGGRGCERMNDVRAAGGESGPRGRCKHSALRGGRAGWGDPALGALGAVRGGRIPAGAAAPPRAASGSAAAGGTRRAASLAGPWRERARPRANFLGASAGGVAAAAGTVR